MPKFTPKTLQELQAEIKGELRGSELKGTYSHNIIAYALRAISARHGVAEANATIRKLRLDKYGWDEQTGEEPVVPVVKEPQDPLERVMNEP